MINVGYTRIEEIIHKIKENYGLDIDISSAKEFVWDVIGYTFNESMLVDRFSEIEIMDYNGMLPEDLYNPTNMMIREKKSKYPLTETTDSFTYAGNTVSRPDAFQSTPLLNYSENNITPGSLDANTPIVITYGENVVYPNGSVDSTIYGAILPVGGNTDRYTFKVNGDLLRCGIKNTVLEISYQAFPMYDDYTPKIPNDANVIRMCVDYIAFKVATKLWFKDELSREKKDWIETQYYHSAASAITKSNTPGMARMEQIKNRVISLIPRVNEFNSGFQNLDQQDTLRV